MSEQNGNGPSEGQGQAVQKREARPALAMTSERSVGAIIPQDIEQAYRLANAICHADMAPRAYNKDPNKVMVGILHGMEIGLTPMAALQSIAVINGMPTVWGDGAMALVENSGLLENKKEYLEGEGEGVRAVCRLKRKGREEPIVQTFSWDEAKKAGLTRKQGPWQEYPRRMLQMRARAWALRDGFSDVLKGLGIAEEAHDMGMLTPQPDGTYAPPRPTRQQYAAPSEEPTSTVEDPAEQYAERMAQEAPAAPPPPQDTQPAAEPQEAPQAPQASEPPQEASEPPQEAESGENGIAAQHKVELIDADGVVQGIYTSYVAYFDDLKQMIAASKDPQAALEVNRAGAESWDKPGLVQSMEELAEEVARTGPANEEASEGTLV